MYVKVVSINIVHNIKNDSDYYSFLAKKCHYIFKNY